MKNFKNCSVLVLVIVLFASLLGGCTPSSNGAQDLNADQNTLLNKGSDIVFPFTIKDSKGREIEITAEVMKVVSLAPNLTEVIYALNKGDKLIGRSNYCDYPEQVASVSSVGDMDLPDIEKIIALKPDLVVCSTITKKEIVNKLEEVGIKVFTSNHEQSLDGVYSEIQDMGKLISASEQANSLISEMKSKLEAIEVIASKVPKKPSVYYVVSYGKYGDFTPGKGTFIDEAISMAGGVNAAKDAVNWAYSLEKLVEKNPEVIIVSKYGETKKGFMFTNGYKELDAVKENKVFEIDNNMLDRVGPRMVDGIEALSKILHPQLWK